MTPSPTHHPADDTLLRHAAGRLSAGATLVVATHLAGCPHCQLAARLGEAIGGVLLADTAPAAMATDALDRTLARLDTPASIARPPANATDPVPDLAPGVPMPAPLRHVARRPWRWVAPGISRIRLDLAGAAPGEHAYLLRVAPGATLAEHGHRGEEITCVLSGQFRDSTGLYGPGDVAEMDVGQDHQPITEPGAVCICLIATQGRLRMRGTLARLLQPLVGV